MSNYHSDPTAGAAIGSVDREFGRLRKQALRLQELQKQGRVTPELEAKAKKQFLGIYRHLFEKAMRGELKTDRPKKGAVGKVKNKKET